MLYSTEMKMIKMFTYFSRAWIKKENVLARLDFELAYNDVAVQNINHYVTRSSSEDQTVALVEISHLFKSQ